jgi:uncharacterized protein DUF4339
MRAEAMSWDDWSVNNPPPIAHDDKWHVEFEPNEVKIVSLDQLDDLFRLSIVDSETKVWQAGMSEWQPLRVIAGLDEQPTPAPKRSPPRPPAPPLRSVAPSVRPAPPAPRSATPSVRPAPPAPRGAPSVSHAPPAARPAYVAPASFYPEPIQASPSAYPPAVAYAAPIAFAAPVQAMSSVRPLVVSHAPPVARGGGGFGRFLVGISLLAGVSVTAYRNDFLREGAHAAHQDALYSRLEGALGGPAFGTLRELEQSLPAEPSFAASSLGDATVRTADTGAAALTVPALATTTTPVVALESLSQERKGPAAAVAAATPTTAALASAAPARAVESLVQRKQTTAPVAAKAPAAKAAPAKPVAAPKPAIAKPAPSPQKSASEGSERERLNAAIGQSMMQADAPKSKAKSKSKGNEYDPLNPTL